MGAETEVLEKTNEVTEPDATVVLPEVIKPAEAKVEPEPAKVEETKIDWEQKYKEYQRADFHKTSKWKKEIAELKEMVATVMDKQRVEELDDNGNVKVVPSNADKVRQSNFEETYNERLGDITSILQQNGIAGTDPRLELANELWIEGKNERNSAKLEKAEKAVRMLTMTPNNAQTVTPRTPIDPKAAYNADVQKGVEAALKKMNINPTELLKVDTQQNSEGSGRLEDNDFITAYANGSIPLTKANLDRFNNLMK